mgnify:CR=1 FL=1
MKKRLLLFAFLPLLTAQAQTDRVGAGTTTPRAGFDLSHHDGLLATGAGPRLEPKQTGDDDYEPGRGITTDLPTGSGTRLMWVPAWSALRAGTAKSSEWNAANVGLFSTALGWEVTAKGQGSTALGVKTIASGAYSTALGVNASTDGKDGAFVIGDNSKSQLLVSGADNQFSARFVGGYQLFTNRQMTIGVSLAGGGNSWEVISDSTKKENFRPADGAQFLRKIAAMRLGSWNYRGQDKTRMRHYGPMAQDFFAAFGHDGVGTVGCDTLINQADFDGVNLIAIKALLQEVEQLKAENGRLKIENAALGRETASLRADVDSIKRLLVANTGK